ncbi:MAG: hypothetical protein K2K73_02690 [Ureaplasma sp.]|nr:hypothetical protein [Ureaplasma sp.]
MTKKEICKILRFFNFSVESSSLKLMKNFTKYSRTTLIYWDEDYEFIYNIIYNEQQTNLIVLTQTVWSYYYNQYLLINLEDKTPKLIKNIYSPKLSQIKIDDDLKLINEK